MTTKKRIGTKTDRFQLVDFFPNFQAPPGVAYATTRGAWSVLHPRLARVRRPVAMTMNRETLLKQYDRLAGLVGKLPGGLRNPILRELRPIRELFLEQRPARLVLFGAGGPSVPGLLCELQEPEARGEPGTRAPGEPPPLPAEAPSLRVEAGASNHGWRSYRIPAQGAVEVLDAREDTPGKVVEAALEHQAADIVLLFTTDGVPSPSSLARLAKTGGEKPAAVVGLVLAADSRQGIGELRPALHHAAPQRTIRVLPWTETHHSEVCGAICDLLPLSAQLEFARLTRNREARARVARTLLKSFTAVCGVIGMQPIPLADLPLLTTIQTLMVGLIIHTSGRPFGPRVLAEFTGALGINVGAAMLFREGARALVRVVPIWGNAVSGFVAGAGTYAIGRAAIAYFIEDLPARETRKLFHTVRAKRLPDKPT